MSGQASACSGLTGNLTTMKIMRPTLSPRNGLRLSRSETASGSARETAPGRGGFEPGEEARERARPHGDLDRFLRLRLAAQHGRVFGFGVGLAPGRVTPVGDLHAFALEDAVRAGPQAPHAVPDELVALVAAEPQVPAGPGGVRTPPQRDAHAPAAAHPDPPLAVPGDQHGEHDQEPDYDHGDLHGPAPARIPLRPSDLPRGAGPWPSSARSRRRRSVPTSQR